MHSANERGHRPSSAGQCNCSRPSALRHAHERLNAGRARRTCQRRDSFKAGEPSSESHANDPPSPFGPSTQAITRANAAERQASAGARDGVKGKRRTLAARAPLHALVRLRAIATAVVRQLVSLHEFRRYRQFPCCRRPSLRPQRPGYYHPTLDHHLSPR